MGIFKGVLKWPRKRPREPGRPGSPVGTPIPDPSQSPRKRFTKLFMKRQVAPQLQGASVVQSTPNDRADRRSLVLDVTALVARTLLIASDAPVVNIAKPFAALFDLACQKVQVNSDTIMIFIRLISQTVHSCKETIERLEKQAAQVAGMINDSLDPAGMIPPQVHDIHSILDEIARFLDATESTKRKLRLWLTAAQEQVRAKVLSERLRDAVSLLGVATALDLQRSSARAHIGSVKENAQAQSCQDADRSAVPSPQPGKFARRIDISTSQIAFFVYRAGVSWVASAAHRGQYVKIADGIAPLSHLTRDPPCQISGSKVLPKEILNQARFVKEG
ncbi:hypothetical protein B0H19DRAFT_129549 [Mycena capillaripes]|nr:hypothetical protein B0H19DRAFT_129549 [Mycena capillaripes]